MTSKGVERQAKTMFCPNCDGKNDLREILYGLPKGPPNPRVYQLGGCCVSKDDPALICVSCGRQGIAEERGSSLMGKPKVVSLFSGCGGMDLGFKNAGYELVWANDFEKAACDTYAKNLGNHIVHGDITELDLKQIPDCDVMIGGFPCQDFSMIWKRGGLETDRGNLYKYFVKAVQLKKPKVFVAENVKGLLTANKGAAVKTITEDFARIGYKVSVDLYNFADYGVPQIRQRIFIVGVRNDVKWEFSKPEPTHEKGKYVSAGKALVGVKRVKLNNEHQNIAEKTKKMLNLIPEGGNFSDIPKNHPLYVKGMISHVYRRLDRSKPSTTIIAGGGGGTWGYHFEEPRPLTNRERARLFCYPDEFEFIGSITEVRKQIGNSVPPLAAKILAEALLPAFKATFKIQDQVKSSTRKNAKIFPNETRLKSRAM